MGLRDFTLFDVIARNARLFGDRTAFVCDGRRISHGEHLERVERLAAGLADAGIGIGDRVAVLAQNSLEYVDLYGAAARQGAIVLPINWRLGADEIAYAIADGTPKMVVAGTDYAELIVSARDKFPSVERYHAFGVAPAPFRPFDDLVGPAPSCPAADVPVDAGFVIIHTAAVGGRPRGALISHAGLLAAGLQLLCSWSLGPDDVNLGMLPLFHVSGLGLLLAVQQAGGSTLVQRRFDPEAAVRHIEADKVTLFAEFPPMLGALLDGAVKAGRDLSSLRVVTGLDSVETINRFEACCPGAQFWAVYGQSELSGMATLAPFRDRPGSAGRPILLTNVMVVDDLDHPLPAGQVGEIVVRGPTVFKGYWNCDADNAQTFRGGWHHTGDMGRFDQDGYLWYAGRSPAKELIKPGGENVYPAEVEEVILGHPAIAEVAVFGVADAHWGEAVSALCVCRPGQTVSAEDLIEFVGSRLARYKRPKHVIFASALPRTAAGAVDRARVKQEHGAAGL